MKHLILIAGLVMISAAVAEAGLPLIPYPAQVTQSAGKFALGDRSLDDAKVVAFKKVEGLPAEGYTLDVTTNGVTITASTPAGEFYARQTLRQLVTRKTIPCVGIRDEPRMAWRGIMLDESRHFFGKQDIKTLLDQMAELKLNVFHWHLTDDHGWRIEIKKYPKLTSVGAWRPVTPMEKDSPHIANGKYGGFYTQHDIREIVVYAAARHIRIVPEIDMPGHMSAAVVAYPALSPANGWTPVIARGEQGSGERCAALCVGRAQTIQFCKDVLTEVMELFPSKEIHIGGDEVFYEQWDPCPDMQALKQKLDKKDWEEVQVAFGNEMSEFLEAHGRRAVFWNNIYRQSVDKRSINQFWRSMVPAREFANAGYDVVLSDKPNYYFNQRPPLQRLYMNDPFALQGLLPAASARLLGIEGCLWTERVPTFAQVQRYLFPRILAIAETAWTPQENKNWERFQERL